MPVYAEQWNKEPIVPKLTCPTGIVDTHMHMFGDIDAYPFAPGSKYISALQTPETALALHERLGITNAIFISSGGYGTNPAYLKKVLSEHGGHFKGVALLPEDVTKQEMRELDDLGVVGLRFISPQHGGALPIISRRNAELCADMGWIVHHYPYRAGIIEDAPVLLDLPNDIVLDHFAHVDAHLGVDQPAVTQLLKLLDTGRVWIKLSGPMRCTLDEPPYSVINPIAQKLVAHAPERLIWGSDWPHLNMNGRTMTNDADLLDMMLDWVPDAATRNAILSTNALELYRFDQP